MTSYLTINNQWGKKAKQIKKQRVTMGFIEYKKNIININIMGIPEVEEREADAEIIQKKNNG